jgi:cytochrome o ubiquinol oxidase subunit 3
MSDNEHTESKDLFGFWIYIMSDCILFAALFATYAVLRGATHGGPDAHELFSMPYVLVETMILLTSSFTYGLGMLAARAGRKNLALALIATTFALGFSFIVMEVNEFHGLIAEGASWSRSAFLSAFFTLVGTHGLHVASGLIWMFVASLQVIIYGITPVTLRKLSCLGLFWHFLDIIWIFVFTVVYLMGAI